MNRFKATRNASRKTVVDVFVSALLLCLLGMSASLSGKAEAQCPPLSGLQNRLLEIGGRWYSNEDVDSGWVRFLPSHRAGCPSVMVEVLPSGAHGDLVPQQDGSLGAILRQPWGDGEIPVILTLWAMPELGLCFRAEIWSNPPGPAPANVFFLMHGSQVAR